mgnify:CR=1 FL=1
MAAVATVLMLVFLGGSALGLTAVGALGLGHGFRAVSAHQVLGVCCGNALTDRL